jgi:protein-disulfide isomerase
LEQTQNTVGTLGKKNPDRKSRPFNYRIFLTFSCVAVVAAFLLIMMGRVSSQAVVNINATPIASSAPNQPTPASAAPKPTPAPGVSSTQTPITIKVSATTKGIATAPVKIINYSDFQCGHCQEFALTTEKELDKKYVATGKVYLEFKHFIVFGEESKLAAQVAEFAAEQNKFWPFHDLLMADRISPDRKPITLDQLKDLGKKAGLDLSGLDAAIQSGKYIDKINQDQAEGKDSGVTGTPSFLVNGKYFNGAPSQADFETIIDELIKSSGQK